MNIEEFKDKIYHKLGLSYYQYIGRQPGIYITTSNEKDIMFISDLEMAANNEFKYHFEILKQKIKNES